MMCKVKNIKELLPAYLEQGLDHAGRERVEKHLEACKDCRAELSLLRMMAEEPVPDPGEAFWLEMPDRIYREVRIQKSSARKMGWSKLSGFPEKAMMPRWAWAAVSIAIVAAVSWFLLRPTPVEIAVTSPADDEPLHEDVLTSEPLDVAGLEASDLKKVTKWADKEFAAIRNEAAGYSFNGTDTDVYDELAELSTKELERLSQILDGMKREV